MHDLDSSEIALRLADRLDEGFLGGKETRQGGDAVVRPLTAPLQFVLGKGSLDRPGALEEGLDIVDVNDVNSDHGMAFWT